MTPATLWPYDEVTLKVLEGRRVLIDAPWMSATVTLEETEWSRARGLAEKFTAGEIGMDDLSEVNWFFRSLATYPFCYIIPGSPSAGTPSRHVLGDSSLLGLSPGDLLVAAALHREEARAVADAPLFADWKWDLEGALQFAQVPGGVDPRALFSVARRYHLLGALESDATDRLYAFVRTLKPSPDKFMKASALMVRQNHYVTERCHSSLIPALATAQGARSQVEHFIEEENGHDRILAGALRSMVADPAAVPVMPQAKVLMDLLKFSAERNFLAFAIVVDAFERSSYQDSDPLAQVLEEGGLTRSARQIDRHKNINDSGEHENLALSFLASMETIDAGYAAEALRIAEVASNAMNQVSAGVHRFLMETDHLGKA